MKRIVSLLALTPVLAFAQQAGRDAFMQQQAYAEMQRVSSQVSTLQSSIDNLASRVAGLEGKRGGDQTLRAEIESLKASVAELKRELANQRSEIVKDLSGRLAKMQPKTPPAPKTQTVVISEPTSTYEVRGGDTLSVVAQAFNTSVAKIKKMNGLKSDNLRIGQKLIVPQVQ